MSQKVCVSLCVGVSFCLCLCVCVCNPHLMTRRFSPCLPRARSGSCSGAVEGQAQLQTGWAPQAGCGTQRVRWVVHGLRQPPRIMSKNESAQVSTPVISPPGGPINTC